MGKVVAIGQSELDIVYDGARLVESFVGGRIANMAASLGRLGIGVEFVSECAADKVGDMVVDFLSDNGVGVASVDRFTDGQSQISLVFRNSGEEDRYCDYVKYPSDRFDVLWPRIEENDIVVFGSFFAIEESVRRPLLELLGYARERKAIVVYLPGFHPCLCNRITRVMPSILENLELSDVVIARVADMQQIFGKTDSKKCYDDHISFYCPNFVFADADFGIHVHAPGVELPAAVQIRKPANRLGWNASLCAGVVCGMLQNAVQFKEVGDIGGDVWGRILSLAGQFVADSLSTGKNIVSESFAKSIKQQSSI